MTVEHRGSGPGSVIGRDAELARVGRFLDEISVAPSALLFEGEPGIGKTTVWAAAIGAAESRGFRVLQARASETERAWTSSKSPSLISEPISSSCCTGGFGRETSLGALKTGGSCLWGGACSPSPSMAKGCKGMW